MDPFTLFAIGSLVLSAIGVGSSIYYNEQNQQIQQEENYDNAVDNLTDMQNSLDTLISVTIPQTEADIAAVQTYLDTWQQNYDNQTAIAKLEIQTYDDFLANWQASYDEQLLSAEQAGKSNLDSLMANWSDAEVVAADRGMGGSMEMVANEKKQKIVDYAGSDMSLEGSDGMYGLQMNNLQIGLTSQYHQAESTLSVLNNNLSFMQQELLNEYDVQETQLDILNDTLDMYNNNQATLQANITDQEVLVADLKKEAGL